MGARQRRNSIEINHAKGPGTPRFKAPNKPPGWRERNETMADYFTLRNDHIRHNAISAILNAPNNSRVTIAEGKRSTAQNSKLWAMLSDIANAKPEDRNWTPETWKCAFMHYLGHQVRFCEGLDGTGPFPIGFHSSRLTVKEMADLITCISAYGDEHGVDWQDTRKGGFWEDQAA